MRAVLRQADTTEHPPDAGSLRRLERSVRLSPDPDPVSRRRLIRPSGGTLVGASLDSLDAALRTSRDSVRIAAPFLSLPVAQLMVRATRFGSSGERRLLTALNEQAIDGGYLDPWAITEFERSEFEIRSLRNVHAKVVLIDNAWGVIGSGNLTEAGSNGGNAELGIVLTPDQTATATSDFFDRWWRVAEPIDPEYLERLRKRVRRRAPARDRRDHGQGGFYRTEPGTALERYRADPQNSGYWLKIMYGDEDRARAATWRRTRWVNDRHTDTPAGPARRPTYAIGDLLVVYLSRGARRGCPAIMRVAGPPVFDPQTVAAASPGDETKWAWVTPVECVIARSLRHAPTLADIAVDSRSVRQQSHIRISPESYRQAVKTLAPR
jgi:hypothetical protein